MDRTIAAFVAFAACQGPPPGGEDLPPSDPSTGALDTPDLPPSTASTETTTPATQDRVVQFVALGDAGEGNTAQHEVAAAIEQVCLARGCEFALYLGDNFYDSGVDSPDDSQFQTKFEDVYRHLWFPFYVVLGNHDYGADGLGIEFWKSDHYIDYAATQTQFVFPNTYYSFTVEHVQFIAFNTTELFFGLTWNQADWVTELLSSQPPEVEWTLGFGHHPYISNGQHGNAGTYEGIPEWTPLTEIPRGQFIQEFFDDNLCGNLQVYLSGHDHNRQVLEPNCGTEFIVSGAGAKTTDMPGRGNPTFFEDDTKEGFLWVEIRENLFTAAFYDSTGALDYEQTFAL